MAAAFAADGPSGVSADHIFVLNLVSLGLQFSEEIVDPEEMLIPLPEDPLLFRSQQVVWGMDREIKLMGVEDQLLLEIGHCIAAPAGNGILVY